jgi:hypothetical protein
MWSFEHRCKLSEDGWIKENFVPLALQVNQPDFFAELCGHGLTTLAKTRGHHLVLAAYHHAGVDMTSNVKSWVAGVVHLLDPLDLGHRKRRSPSDATGDPADLRGLGPT